MLEKFFKRKIEYVPPIKTLETDVNGYHKFEMLLDGKVIAGAELMYYSKPLPMYNLQNLYVEYEYQNNKFSSQIMDKVEEFLLKRKKPGILVNAIDSETDKYLMYKKKRLEENR